MSEGERFTVADAQEHAERCVSLALKNAEVELDFSVESLRRVDELLVGWHEEGSTSESMPTTVYLFGCYVGEVIIRNHGGAWVETAGTRNEAVLGFPVAVELPDGTVCNPLGKTSKLLDNGMEDSLLYFYKAFTTVR